MELPEEIIERKFENGEISFEEAEKQFKNLIKGFKKGANE